MKTYVSPIDRTPLIEQGNALLTKDGKCFPIWKVGNFSIPVFINEKETFDSDPLLSNYCNDRSVEFYLNFTNWLFETFAVDEKEFRETLIKKIFTNNIKRVLITGAGLGEDILPTLKVMGDEVEIYANDISKKMVGYAASSLKVIKKNIKLSVCDACALPFPDNYFDVAFHFGGINYFTDVDMAIKEMTRVVRSEGRVGFGDESVGPWLRDIDYGKMAITNNRLWSALPPIDKLPFEAVQVHIEWLLGNCFYFISFTKDPNGPYMNIDIPHHGSRGGTIRTRYYGNLEGVSVNIKERFIKKAKEFDLSVSALLEKVLQDFLK